MSEIKIRILIVPSVVAHVINALITQLNIFPLPCINELEDSCVVE